MQTRRTRRANQAEQADKIQKTLANYGVGSRRQIEAWIKEGRIKVNGKLAEIGMRITSTDKVEVNGRKVFLKQAVVAKTRVLVYNKPEGQVCTRNDPENRPTVFTRLPRLHTGRWINVGRLDINTQGLLLFTNNGELANRLMKPNFQIPRVYSTRILGKVDKTMLDNLRAGVQLEDGMARFESIEFVGGKGANVWYNVTLCEGRNREVRRLWESQGVKVSRLIRVRYGDVKLPRFLASGRWEDLQPYMVNKLLESVKMDVK